ncbi:unnamed protein product [Fraxinus pennsylvanica]|uniref:Uncharacterized protein n=1 Tax=Fraxinus pennsylvanica TaxID=56036 RepID=A0AAD1ZGM4_9LAMI|nr:unnamed protein product [Fraxinus pennsylvanica]
MTELLLPKWEDSRDEKYPHIVYEERCKATDGEKCESVSTSGAGLDELEEELVIGLSRVTWEKVDVSFHNSKLKFAAHSIIQVKEHHMHTEDRLSYSKINGEAFSLPVSKTKVASPSPNLSSVRKVTPKRRSSTPWRGKGDGGGDQVENTKSID